MDENSTNNNNIEINIPPVDFKKIAPMLFLALAAVLLYNSFYTVNANENGVVLRLGKYYLTTQPGLHFKIPFIDTVDRVKVDYQYKEEFGFRTSSAGIKSKFVTRGHADESWMLTGDLNIADVRWVVQYTIKDANAYLFNLRDVGNTIRDVAESTMRLMVGERSFNEVIKLERSKIADDAKGKMQEVLDSYKSGVSIKLVQLQGALPPLPVEDSFNMVNIAKQEQETMINEARQQYAREVERAYGEADKMENEAYGYYKERVNQARGDSTHFVQILSEYNNAKAITRDRYYIETMSRVLSKIPDKIIIDSNLENVLPLLNLKTDGGKK